MRTSLWVKGEETASQLLRDKGYDVFPFQEIKMKFFYKNYRWVKSKDQKWSWLPHGTWIKRTRINKFVLKEISYLQNIFGENYSKLDLFMEKIEPIICEEARLHRSSYGPDFIAVKNDDLVFVEVKMGKGHLTKYQREFFSKAKNIGIRILIILINESIKLNEF
jgi:hypothetical protein